MKCQQYINFDLLHLTSKQDELDLELSRILSEDNLQTETLRPDARDMKQSLRVYIQRQTKFLKDCRDIKVSFQCHAVQYDVIDSVFTSRYVDN